MASVEPYRVIQAGYRPDPVQGTEPMPLFIDIEASSLRRPLSYPTEIAWSTADGRIESRLIRPEPTWSDWSVSAEALTGLSRERLLAEGLPVRQVAEVLNRSLAGATLYCDGGGHDAFWLGRLFEAAGCRCAFQLADIKRLIPAGLDDRPEWPQELRAMVEAARREAGPAHRARSDVRYLQFLYRRVLRSLRGSGCV